MDQGARPPGAGNDVRAISGITSMALVTTSDTIDLPRPTRGLYIGGAGNVNALLVDDSAQVLMTALAVGVIHPLVVRRVFATNTTATLIIACW